MIVDNKCCLFQSEEREKRIFVSFTKHFYNFLVSLRLNLRGRLSLGYGGHERANAEPGVNGKKIESRH